MARSQVSVTKQGIMAEVLAEAMRVFDDADSEGDAFRRLAVDWYRNRQENSKRASLKRLEENNAYLIACMSGMEGRLAAIEMNLQAALRVITKRETDGNG